MAIVWPGFGRTADAFWVYFAWNLLCFPFLTASLVLSILYRGPTYRKVGALIFAVVFWLISLWPFLGMLSMFMMGGIYLS